VHREKVVLCLKWIAFALKPLTVGELVAAVGLGLSDDPPSLAAEEYSKPTLSTAILPAHLLPPGLVVVSDSGVLVSFSHFSVKEYLISDRIKSSGAKEFALDKQATHIQIAQACLRYHLYISKDEIIEVVMLHEFQLRWYAAKFGLAHAEAVAQDQWPSSLYQRLQEVFEHSGAAFRSLVRFQGRQIAARREFPNSAYFPSLLCYAVLRGHLQSLKFLLKSSSLVNKSGGRCRTALNVACHEGNEPMVEALLQAGACPYLGNNYSTCALRA
jgi:hypothetical protein